MIDEINLQKTDDCKYKKIFESDFNNMEEIVDYIMNNP